MRKQYKWLILATLILIFLAVTGCKKDEEEEDTTDRTAPTLERINLADECTSVEATSSLYLLFSEEMADDTLTANTTDTACSGTLQISDDDFETCLQMLDDPQPNVEKTQFTLNLSGQLGYNSDYKIKLTTGATDAAGNALASRFLTATGFTTGADTTGTIYWTKQYGTSQDDYAKGIGLDSGGNIYLTGRTRSSFTGSANSGGWDIFLLKKTSLGADVWEKQIGTSTDDYAEALAIDGSDNIFIAGKTEGTLESGYSGSSDASSDAVLIKYDSGGTEQWRKQLGGNSDDWAFAVAVDSSSNVYITGKTDGSLQGTNQGGSDIFLAKYNNDGTLQWVKQQGTASEDAAYAIAIDSSDNIYVSGHSQGSLGGTSSGERDIVVLKWNSSGTLQWAKQFGSDQDDYSRGIAIDGSSNILVSGYSFGDFATTNQGSSDLVLLKLDGDGSLTWKKQLGSDQKDMGKAVVVDTASNDVYVGGLTEGSMNCKYNRGFSDTLLVKYNSSGTWQWTEQYGSVGLDYGKSLVIDGSGDLLFSGWTNGNIDANISEGNQDLLIFKYDQTGARQ